MTSFKSFIRSVHDAVLAANDALKDSQLQHLNQFFTDEEGNDLTDTSSTRKPRVVVVQYPRRTENGVEMIDIAVPLLTLVPLNMPRVEQVKLQAKLKLQMIDEELHVDFSEDGNSTGQKNSGDEPGETSATTGKVEIVLQANQSPEGLEELIKAYERDLRAQIEA